MEKPDFDVRKQRNRFGLSSHQCVIMPLIVMFSPACLVAVKLLPPVRGGSGGGGYQNTDVYFLIL